MDIAFVKKVVEDNYGIKVTYIEKIKNVYQVCDERRKYCLKVIKYELPHFLFILGTINHLRDNNFSKIPPILRTIDGRQFICIDNCHAYLTPWLEVRECNYDNPADMEKAAVTLANLHTKSKGFLLEDTMKPRVGWFKWVDNFKTRRDEILNFKRKIEEKEKHSEFDIIYSSHIEEELERCNTAIGHILDSNYYSKMMMEVRFRGFCHHDFAHHNVLIDLQGNVNIIDFDYTILDTHLHDLSSLLLRRMKYGKWDINNANFILRAYSSVFPVEEDDVQIMASFMEFPQDFWQVGLQYYWEEQPWGEEFFLKKLGRILDDNDDKQEFIDEFMTFKFKQ